jgi:thiamine-monophosphate kinase
MAARPRWGVLSFGLRAAHEIEALLELQGGVSETLAAHGAALVGGNLASIDGPEWMSLTLIGGVARGKAWKRSGAKPGDRLAVTGAPGRAGAAVRLALRAGGPAHVKGHRPLIEAWRAPLPRVALAETLAAAGGVTAAIDLSDGLAGDLAQLCEASGTGAELDLAAWPRDAALERAAKELGVPASVLRLSASDDYELLLAVDPGRLEACAAIAKRLGVPFTAIGRTTKHEGELLAHEPGGTTRPLAEIAGAGFDHFRPG